MKQPTVTGGLRPLNAVDIFDEKAEGIVRQMDEALKWHRRRSDGASIAGAVFEIGALSRQLVRLAEAAEREQDSSL